MRTKLSGAKTDAQDHACLPGEAAVLACCFEVRMPPRNPTGTIFSTTIAADASDVCQKVIGSVASYLRVGMSTYAAHPRSRTE